MAGCVMCQPVCCAENEEAAQAAADPVKEFCDIGVKVADLGNACWTVVIYIFAIN